ncbi:hypothetical protein XA68_14103 [Ophiocordyceps unilateralis]|uniref:Transmembrane protein n=1 Tax=Ophiocordyceps unilateralis TaxID=268505 RepID=A0A2A9PAW0_OPHUN|nr:hypothetical protein XA68_14103 [Ophiocordyceps unilateralis]
MASPNRLNVAGRDAESPAYEFPQFIASEETPSPPPYDPMQRMAGEETELPERQSASASASVVAGKNRVYGRKERWCCLVIVFVILAGSIYGGVLSAGMSYSPVSEKTA